MTSSSEVQNILGSENFTRWLVGTWARAKRQKHPHRWLYEPSTRVSVAAKYDCALARGNELCRVPTWPGKPGKPGKMRVHLENLEISWDFEKFNKYHGKIIWNLEKLCGYYKFTPDLPDLEAPVYNFQIIFQEKFPASLCSAWILSLNCFLASLCLAVPLYFIWYFLLHTYF